MQRQKIISNEDKKQVLLEWIPYKEQGFISGQLLAQKLGITRTGVWKLINLLRKEGIKIDGSSRRGYTLQEIPDMLLPGLIKRNLNTSFIGKKILYFKEITSTNEIAKQIATRLQIEGTLIIAENQTHGKGRMGRKWLSAPYKNLLFSIILTPYFKPIESFYLTMVASISVAMAIKEITSLDALIKWPNDVYIGNRKVCGILTEFSAQHDEISYIIVGIGVNVNIDPSMYQEISPIATSLYKELGRRVSRIFLLTRILEHMENLYITLINGEKQKIIDYWNSLSLIKDKYVKITSGKDVIEGVASGINENGHLIIIDSQKKKHSILSGDLELLDKRDV